MNTYKKLEGLALVIVVASAFYFLGMAHFYLPPARAAGSAVGAKVTRIATVSGLGATGSSLLLKLSIMVNDTLDGQVIIYDNTAATGTVLYDGNFTKSAGASRAISYEVMFPERGVYADIGLYVYMTGGVCLVFIYYDQ